MTTGVELTRIPRLLSLMRDRMVGLREASLSIVALSHEATINELSRKMNQYINMTIERNFDLNECLLYGKTYSKCRETKMKKIKRNEYSAFTNGLAQNSSFVV